MQPLETKTLKEVATQTGYWYLATPYTLWEGGLDDAYRLACEAAEALLRLRINVYSPIVHSHPLSKNIGNDAVFWLRINRPFLLGGNGLIVVKVDNWNKSHGIGEEIKIARGNHKQIYGWDYADR